VGVHIENYMLILAGKLTIANHLCGIEIFLNSGYVESGEGIFLKSIKLNKYYGRKN